MPKYSIQEINSIAKDMKYEALYWALGFEKKDSGIFQKQYAKDRYGEIDSEKQSARFDGIDKTIPLNTHESFVVIECLDKLLSMGYEPEEISVFPDDTGSDICCKGLQIKCFEWNHIENIDKTPANHENKFINYQSRLVSGLIEREYFVKNHENELYTSGIFELDKKAEEYCLINPKAVKSKDFIIKGTKVLEHTGHQKNVVVPDGVTDLASCLFWDNQEIEEVILPESLINIGGDTFYNCRNLRKVNIPAKVKIMGNNPFAGCPTAEIINNSSNFQMEDGVLYDRNFSKLIYYPISRKEKSYQIKSGTKIVGKHAFFLCSNLIELTIPESVIKLENNPFSGCDKLSIDNRSASYKIIDKVIYDRELSSVIGCLNSIKTQELRLEKVKKICRNSFWNCKGIKKIILPETLETIGYNPFVACSEIEFVSESENFVVENGLLLSKDRTKLICCPAKSAIGEIHIPDSVTNLERGAFSGCGEMTSINLHNVSIIGKSCFTNCDSLKTVYCSDLVAYIGEWAFAHCRNLSEISVFQECFIDKNVVSNTPAKITFRNIRSNYVIESDNLFTLKSMIKNYEGKIKAILIDPPYNSHIDYIGYKDEYEGSGYEKFMEERIELSKTLLSEDGFLVINIDENGLDDIVKVCKRNFGEKHVSVKKWKKKHEFFDANRVVLNPNKVQTDFEFIVFAKKSEKSVFNNIMQPYIENGVLREKPSSLPEIFDCFGTTSSAKDEIEEIFGRRDYFSTPKPVKLLKELIRATTNRDSIVIDFFAGSGTTGHAVFELNREDRGSRKFILVSNSESDICRNVTMKRMDSIGVEYTALC
ncbi:leucine-rich repeat protein [bacterium]|nr:leucine-rich repeat protein [bacterium]